MIEILYRSDQLEVRRVATADTRSQVVTFDSYHESFGTDRPAFGQDFLLREGITAVHVLSHANDWFQYPEMAAVLALIRSACSDAERLMTYGSSMGGYAALRFANAVGAQAALALSPQFSVDSAKAPFETRWPSDRRRIRFRNELEGDIAGGPVRILAYDSALAVDRLHADRLLAAAPMIPIALPYAGHPVGGFLSDIRLLRPLVLTALDGSFDPPRFARAAHARRAGSVQWLATLADRQPPWRTRLGVALARRAVALTPGHAPVHHALARQLSAIGNYEEAIAEHRRAVAAEPIPDYLWGLSKTLHAAGNGPEALAVAERIKQLAPTIAGYHAWTARLRGEAGDVRGQLKDLRQALRLDPRNRAYRWQVMYLRGQHMLQKLRNGLGWKRADRTA